MKIAFTPKFLRRFRELPPELQSEAYEKIDLFKKRENHKRLKVHKLSGKHQGCFSFSVDYRMRIVFEYQRGHKGQSVTFLMIGDHSIYD